MSLACWRPDGVSFTALVLLAVVLFARVGHRPDWRGDVAQPASTGAPGPGLSVQDFAYIFNYARRAAHTPGVSPYSVEQHRQFTAAWMGPHVASALCFAYSPTLVLLLVPLFPLSTGGAWLAWNLAGASAAAWAVRRLAAGDRGLLALGRLAAVSPAAIHCLVLGQTALLTTGVLVGMVAFAEGARRWGAARTWGAAACLFVLGIKLPLAVVAGVALLAAGRWRPLVLGAAATLVVLAGAILWWSPTLVPDYVALVAHYNLVEADPLFRAGYVPDLMSNLRNVLLHTTRADDAQASALSAIVLAPVLAFPVLRAALARRPLGLDLALAWTAIGYALFSPHLSPTEDLIVLLPMAVLWRTWPASRAAAVAAACALGLLFLGGSTLMMVSGTARPTGLLGLLPLAAFVAKGVLAVLVAAAVLADRAPR